MLRRTGDGSRQPRVHFMGIGGTGMVAAARLALDAGWEVRGSDGKLYPPASTLVGMLNVPVADRYAPENLDWKPDVVIVGNALSRGNPEVEAMLDRRIPYLSMAEWLKHEILWDRKSIVIAGTHGKTTTTTLTAYLLRAGELKAGYFIGGQPNDFPFSSDLGEPSAPFVIEGDEYDSGFFDKRAKFLHYVPQIAVVTSLEHDHTDIYESLADIELAFKRLLLQVPASGRVYLCADSPGAMALRKLASCPVETYGEAPDADWRVEAVRDEDNEYAVRVVHGGKEVGTFRSPLFGWHNLQNTAVAVAVALREGVSAEAIARALPQFRGIRRRMEIFHKAEGVTFIDDFAHHPTAIDATLRAARERWPGRRIIALFEPRSNTTATNRFQGKITNALREADIVYIGPIHRPQRFTDDQRLDRDKMCAELAGSIDEARHFEHVDEIVRQLRVRCKPQDIVLIMSNGAFDRIYDRIRTEFSGHEEG